MSRLGDSVLEAHQCLWIFYAGPSISLHIMLSLFHDQIEKRSKIKDWKGLTETSH